MRQLKAPTAIDAATYQFDLIENRFATTVPTVETLRRVSALCFLATRLTQQVESIRQQLRQALSSGLSG